MPLVFLRLLWRSRRAPAYARRWPERLGYFSPPPWPDDKKCLLFHAVSVGEVHAAAPLIKAMQSRHPELQVAVTTSTPTGSARVKEIFGDSVFHVYLPYDVPGAVGRFLDKIHPKVLVIMETELWPNLIHACRLRGVRMLLANARLSPASCRRYLKIPRLAAEMMAQLDRVAAQSPGDAEGFKRLGLLPESMRITGSMKFDHKPAQTAIDQGAVLKESFAGRPVWIAASTRKGEERLVLRAYRRAKESLPSLLLILVPRHPERFVEVFDLCRSQGLETLLRSESKPCGKAVEVFLGDSMGEMGMYYASADLAFVGGSLVDTGCQNVLEPASLGLPVITGPSLYNFQAIADLLQEAGAQRVVKDEEELADTLVELFEDRQKIQAMSQAALRTVAENRGATEKLIALIQEYLGSDQK